MLGKERQIKLAVACLLSEGHLLIEDMPGMGKTTLAHALGKVFNLSYNRIQFTSDILPADIIGAPVFDKENGQFVFHEGPISYPRRVVTLRPELATSVDAVTDAYVRANFIDDRPEDVDTLRKAVRRVRLSLLAGA